MHRYSHAALALRYGTTRTCIRSTILAGLFCFYAPLGVQAQDAPVDDSSPADSTKELETIVIQGTVLRGSALTDIAPDTQYTSQEIAAMGVGSLEELLEEILAQTGGSSRGRGGESPIILINGQRVSGFREVRRYPSEAVERVDVLPEEVALSYGYAANQRVINFVLKQNYSGTTLETEARYPEAGHGETYEFETIYLRINKNGRWNIDAGVVDTQGLLEVDRDLIEEASERSIAGTIRPTADRSEIDPALSALVGETTTSTSAPQNPGDEPLELQDFVPFANALRADSEQAFKSLVDDRRDFSLTGSYNHTLSEETNATATFGVDLVESSAQLGLPRLEVALPANSIWSPFSNEVEVSRFVEDLGPLRREVDDKTLELSVAANHNSDVWIWSTTASLEWNDSETQVDRSLDGSAFQSALSDGNVDVNPFGDVGTLADFETRFTDTETLSGNVQLVASKDVLQLPAGGMQLSTTGAWSLTDRSTFSAFDDDIEETDLRRETWRGLTSLDIPLFSEDMAIPLMNQLSLNANLEISDLSDFGQLKTTGYGINWAPTSWLEVLASSSSEEGAPAISALGDPITSTPNRRVFDFVTGQSILATRIQGGNPDLEADSRDVLKVGLKFSPPIEASSSLRFDYIESIIDRPIASFPNPTIEIQDAFPERFTRDEDGVLLSYDSRWTNLFKQERRELDTQFEYSRAIRSNGRSNNSRGGSGRPPQAGSRGSGGTGRPPGAGSARGSAAGGRPSGGRLVFRVNHVWALDDKLFLDETLAPLDYLNGDAKRNAGGEPEHTVNLFAGIFRNGTGIRLRARWESGTDVLGIGENGEGSLQFSDILTTNVRIFYRVQPNSTIARKAPWLKNSRLAFSIDNIFDETLKVTDETAQVPLSFQPDDLDPLGRTFEIDFRKQLG